MWLPWAIIEKINACNTRKKMSDTILDEKLVRPLSEHL